MLAKCQQTPFILFSQVRIFSLSYQAFVSSLLRLLPSNLTLFLTLAGFQIHFGNERLVVSPSPAWSCARMGADRPQKKKKSAAEEEEDVSGDETLRRV